MEYVHEHDNEYGSEAGPQDEWLIEFSQAYDDGFEVIKRGLDASPMVVRKYKIVENEVMSFTSYQYANKALTAFHFHPDFPDEDRRTYMNNHEEGHDLAVSVGSRRAAQRALFRRDVESRLSDWGRGLSMSLHGVALYLAAGGPAAR